jgi:NAD(P)-dependent dehydrogenase (short-subunit alcohol dehydrogenase family)
VIVTETDEITARRATIVTGAGSGIGRACALRQAALGEEVHAWDIDGGAAREVAEEIEGTGGMAQSAAVDVGDTLAAAAAVQEVASGGRLGGLVHAAGLMRTIPFEDVDEHEYDRIMRVNQRGTFFIVKAAARCMTARGGAIVLFSSIGGRKGRPLAAPYAASKAAVISIAQSAAMSYGPRVRVNAVAPGMIATPMMQQIAEERHRLLGSSLEDPYPGVEETLPLKRFGTPDDVARVVEFLLGPLSGYVTGQTINVDGGYEYD